MKMLIATALFAIAVVPNSAVAQIRFRSPGAAAVEAIERRELCESIIKAGGRCPSESVPIADVRAYYQRLVDANWERARAEQQQLLAQAQLEQRIMTAITSALLIQEQEFRRRLAALEDELADLQRQLRLALSDTGAPGSAAPPVPTSPVVRLKHVDFYEAPGGTFQRFTASQIDAGEVVFAPIPGGVIEHNDKMWIRVRLTTTGGAERVGYFDAEQVRADWTATK